MERGEIIDRLIAVKKHAGIRLGVPAGARSRDDAAAGRAPSRHPAARHRREHLARHHRDLHLRAGAVLGARRPLAPATPRCATARASISASRCRSCRIWAPPAWSRRCRTRKGDLGLVPAFAVAGAGAWWTALEGRRARRRSSRGCRSSSAPTIRPRCRCSWFRAAAPDAHGDRGRGLERAGRRLGRRRPRARSAHRRSRSPCRTAPSTARRCWSRCRRGELDDDHGRAGQGRRLGALHGPRRQPRDPLYGAGQATGL